MAISAKHKFVSPKDDGVDSTLVQPSNWNDEHLITLDSGKVLGRMSAGNGAVEELPIAVDATGQSLVPPSGTTAQRPATPSPGMIRFNTTTGQLEAYQNGQWGNFSDTAQAAMAEARIKGRAVGAGSGPPQDLTKAQVQRLVYNIGTAYPTFNSTPDDGFIFPYGQNLSRTTYAELFAKWGTTFGNGDGSTTFGCPDVRGRAIVGKDDMGGVAAGRLTGLTGGIDGLTLGAVGGAETHTLSTAELPSHNHNASASTDGAHTHTYGPKTATYGAYGQSYADFRPSAGDSNRNSVTLTTNSAGDHTHTITVQNAGGGGPHNNVQPSIVANIQIYTGVHA